MSNTDRPAGGTPEYLTSEEARAFLRYENSKAFTDAIARDGIPVVRVNSRRFLFPRQALHAWLERRTAGTSARAA